MVETTSRDWRSAIAAFLHPRVITMLFLGFSAGLPLLLIFSSLSLWLNEAGVERSAITLFSWAALGYSFKFIWAPLVDRLPIPLLTAKLGRRRGWLLLAQCLVMIAIIAMALVDPQLGGNQLGIMAVAAVALGFSSATQDIVIDAYRIESASEDLQAMMSATYIAGYRVALLVSGAGSLFLAQTLGSTSEAYAYEAWQATYFIMSIFMLVGITTTVSISEPERGSVPETHPKNTYVRFVGGFAIAVVGFVAVFANAPFDGLFASGPFFTFLAELLRIALAAATAVLIAMALVRMNVVDRSLVVDTYVMPIRDFFQRYGRLALWLLVLVGLYRISDIVLGVIANVFYSDMGFSKFEIAAVVKSFGLVMTLLGGFVGGVASMRFGVIRMLFVGAVLTVLTNLLFVWLAHVGYDMTLLYVVIAADNLTAGLASAAFIAFLSSLTNVKFTAVQYAIFSSLMTLLPKVIGGYSGALSLEFGYVNFFLFASLLGVPVLWLVSQVGKKLSS